MVQKMKASLTLTALSVMIGIFFLMMGTLKLSVWPSVDLHRDVRKTFIRLARVWPWTISANHYRKCIGSIEMFGGLSLIFLPGMLKFKLMVNSVLVVTTVTLLLNMYATGEKLERTAQVIVFLFMTICRVIVHFQVRNNWKKAQKLRSDNEEPTNKEQKQGGKKLKTG